jgi:hypothetical protein
MAKEIPSPVLKIIMTRASAETQPLAVAFATEALRRSVDLHEHKSDKAATYFRVVHTDTTVAYVRPRREAVRIECRIPYGRLPAGPGFGFDGAFGPSYAIDLNDKAELTSALRMLDEAIQLAASGF